MIRDGEMIKENAMGVLTNTIVTGQSRNSLWRYTCLCVLFTVQRTLILNRRGWCCRKLSSYLVSRCLTDRPETDMFYLHQEAQKEKESAHAKATHSSAERRSQTAEAGMRLHFCHLKSDYVSWLWSSNLFYLVFPSPVCFPLSVFNSVVQLVACKPITSPSQPPSLTCFVCFLAFLVVFSVF